MQQYIVEDLLDKWEPVLEHEDLPNIPDYYKRNVTATLLENQERASRSEGEQAGAILLGETPTNAIGTSAAPSASPPGSIDIFDPVLISLVRRSMPNLIAYDIAGVQPMTGPTGLIFALRARYGSQEGTEALFNEADTDFSGSAAGNTMSGLIYDANTTAEIAGTNGPTVHPRGSGSHTGTDPTQRARGSGYTVGTGMQTLWAEALGRGDDHQFQQMAFSIEKVAVTAVSRALKAEYTIELAQDLKAVHGLDAETELSNILSAEILTEINREVVRTINYTATTGAQENVATAGRFNLDVDSNGRWSVERFKGMIFQIEREANQLAKATRRGKGNIMICSSDVASALQMAGMLDYTPQLSADLNVDDTGNTFAGVLSGRIRVYIDPYFATSTTNMQYMTVGYKGSNQFDAGIFYCPYVPLQMVRAVGEDSFQPRIGFKTRYGMVANPFAGGTRVNNGVISFDKQNVYYRLVGIQNLM